jgi:[NiFe] hydrogenase assembly HybE family chaperone
VDIASPDPSGILEREFSRIAATSMADMPLNNPALRVEAVGFRIWQGVWVGITITPWAMNLVLLPAGSSHYLALALGQRQNWDFPAGTYTFIGGAIEALGSYQFCSLFSPAFEFTIHEDAHTAALAALDALFAPPRQETAAPAVTPESTPVSRRNFLRGDLFGRR